MNSVKNSGNSIYTPPSMRDDYPWHPSRPDVPDSRDVAKNNDAYHSLEKFGGQYASQAMYTDAAAQFQTAALLRREQMQVLPQLVDTQHQKAADTAENLGKYYLALSKWQDIKPIDIKKTPKPTDFDLSKELVDRIEKGGSAKISEKLKELENNSAAESEENT